MIDIFPGTFKTYSNMPNEYGIEARRVLLNVFSQERSRASRNFSTPDKILNVKSAFPF